MALLRSAWLENAIIYTVTQNMNITSRAGLDGGFGPLTMLLVWVVSFTFVVFMVNYFHTKVCPPFSWHCTSNTQVVIHSLNVYFLKCLVFNVRHFSACSLMIIIGVLLIDKTAFGLRFPHVCLLALL